MSTSAALHIQISVESTEEARIGAIALNMLSQDIADTIRVHGMTPKGVPTGEKGGEVIEVVRQIAQAAYENKDIIIALSGVAAPIVSYLLKRREEHQKKFDDDSKKSDSIVVIVQTEQPVRREIAIDRSLGEDNKLLARLLEMEADLPAPTGELPMISVQIRVAE
jgi:hypothetical protein